ncbi:MAG: DUF308 domain-containing protein [Candidatus Saccharibacteria bacterium]|nr:DUF308 domain-containing protein [Candidatus Saccharibacteria bacterium]
MAKTEITKLKSNKIGGDIKRKAWFAVIESLCLIVLGVLFVAWPDMMVQIVSYVVGAILMIRGAFQVINYFIEKGQNDFFNDNLLAGVISILAGLAVLLIGNEIANLFRIVIGIFMIYEALVRINMAVKLSAVGIAIWKYILLVAIAILILGIFITFNDVTTIIGWMMIVGGVVGIVGDIIFIQMVDAITERYTSYEETR